METLDNIRILRGEMTQLSSVTRKVISSSINDLENLLSTYVKLFGTSKDGLDDLLSTSNELRVMHDELTIKIKEQAEEIQRVNEVLEEQRDYYSLTEQEQAKVIKNLTEQRERLAEIEQLKLKLNSADVDEAQYAQNRIDKIKTEIIARQKIINDLETSNENAYVYAKSLKETDDDTLDTLEKIRDTHQDISESARQTAIQTERGKDALKQQEKNLESILKAASYLWNYAKGCAKAWEDFNDVAFKSGRAIGMNRDQAINYQSALVQRTKDLGGAYGITHAEMTKFQDSYAASTGRAIMLNNEETESLAAMSKLAGEGVASSVIGEMDNFGASIDTAFGNLAVTQERAMKFGLNVQKSGELFAKNIQLASKYTFKEGIEGVSKMTLLSQRLKINLASIGVAADKFSTIEGAISTSANLQMLGGSYAANFGNPMEVQYEAMNDFEAFMERLVDTFASKGVFNKKTGEVEVGAMDKRFIKEAAAQLGISQEEAMNLTMSKIKFNLIESQINKSKGFNKSEETAIGNLATWDADKQEHIINYLGAEGENKKVAVRDIDKTTLDYIQRQTLGDEAMQKDVKDIAKVVTAAYKDRAKGTTSWRESKSGLTDVHNAMKTDAADGIMSRLDNWVKDMTGGKGALHSSYKHVTNNGEFYIPLAGMAGAAAVMYKARLASYAKKALLKRGVGRGGLLGGYTPPSPSGNLPNGGGGGGKWLGRIGKYIPKSKKGLIAGGLALLTGGALLMSNSSSKEGYDAMDSIKAKEAEENTINGDGTNNPILNELKIQTSILEAMASGSSPLNKLGSGESAQDTLDNLGQTGAITANIAHTKLGAKGLKAISGRGGLKLAANAGKLAKAANPWMWASLGVDGINELGKASGAWEEEGNTDKIMKIGASTANGAGIGAMVGTAVGPIGTAVGTAVGAAIGAGVGIYDEYGDDIKKWAVGEDSMTENDKTQVKYEETKFGVTSISDPQLQMKASLATVKIHDVLLSIWYKMNGKQTNNKEEDKGFFGDLWGALSTPFNSNANSLVTPIRRYEERSNGLFSSPNPIKHSLNMNSVMDNSGYGMRNLNIRSLPTVGRETYISRESSIKNQFNGGVGIPDMNININGTLKLATDNKSVDVDIKKLLDNPQFRESIIKMVKDGFDKNQGLGKINRNNITSQRVSSGYNKK